MGCPYVGDEDEFLRPIEYPETRMAKHYCGVCGDEVFHVTLDHEVWDQNKSGPRRDH